MKFLPLVLIENLLEQNDFSYDNIHDVIVTKADGEEVSYTCLVDKDNNCQPIALKGEQIAAEDLMYAIRHLHTLINCKNTFACTLCFSCVDCMHCHQSTGLVNCSHCSNSTILLDCQDCSYCDFCSSCSSISYAIAQRNNENECAEIQELPSEKYYRKYVANYKGLNYDKLSFLMEKGKRLDLIDDDYVDANGYTIAQERQAFQDFSTMVNGIIEKQVREVIGNCSYEDFDELCLEEKSALYMEAIQERFAEKGYTQEAIQNFVAEYHRPSFHAEMRQMREDKKTEVLDPRIKKRWANGAVEVLRTNSYKEDRSFAPDKFINSSEELVKLFKGRRGIITGPDDESMDAPRTNKGKSEAQRQAQKKLRKQNKSNRAKSKKR